MAYWLLCGTQSPYAIPRRINAIVFRVPRGTFLADGTVFPLQNTALVMSTPVGLQFRLLERVNRRTPGKLLVE